jgi:hypothetical protein
MNSDATNPLTLNMNSDATNPLTLGMNSDATNPTNIGHELRCTGREGSSCSSSVTHRGTLVKNMISQKVGQKDRIVTLYMYIH